MAKILYSSGTLTVICPHCKAETDVDDLEIAVTISGVDIMTLKGQGDNEYVCEACGEEFNVSAECDLYVTKEAK